MPRPWTLLDSVATSDGPLELRRRGERDFMISVAGRVLMSSNIHESETAVATLACQELSGRPRSRILIGGLGLGFTLRAALDALPFEAEVTVAELTERVVDWCRGPAACLTDGATSDPRVTLVVGDVAAAIRAAATGKLGGKYDAIIVDLYIGPDNTAKGDRDPLYGAAILKQCRRALRPGGVYAVWGEAPSPRFEARVQAAGFETRLIRTRGAGPRHAVYIATRISRE